jgi:hypothetical protein
MKTTEVSRRAFIASSTAAAFAQTGSSGRLKAGLIGCGGRGTQATVDLLTGNPDVELAAMADVFEDKLEGSLAQLRDPKYISRSVERGGNTVNKIPATEELVSSISRRRRVTGPCTSKRR